MANVIFSIIIPLYNKGALTKKSIDSVLSQECQKFEIIVVDDGSTDDSSYYVKNCNDERVSYYYKENGGVSSARNYGIEKVRGEWIVFLDADDEMFPGTLESYKESICKNSKARIHVSKQNNNYEGRGALQRLFNIIRGNSHKTNCPFFSHWLRLFFPCPGTVCISKSLIDERGGFKEHLSFYEDIEFMLRLMKDNKVAYNNHYSLKYNQEPTGLSGSYHPLDKEMAYYIPEMIQSVSFWYKALLYENLEQEIYWWQLHGSEENAQFYRDMQKKYFSRVFAVLHWIRQKMIRRGII